MILLRKTILTEAQAGNLHIHPLEPRNIGPNSVDVTLAPLLRVYKAPKPKRLFSIGYLFRTLVAILSSARAPHVELDVKSENDFTDVVIPESGYVLLPGVLYIGSTNESASSKVHVPMYEGRSSMGRLGISSACCAGFGDVGFAHDDDGNPTGATWTLEITVTHRVRIYPNTRIGQVFFISGDHVPESDELYKGKYSYQTEAMPSLAHLDKN